MRNYLRFHVSTGQALFRAEKRKLYQTMTNGIL